ncbi:glycosyltransferase 87 family protein [Nakamurella panacisegetis]|uniref:glycosyltransferase 87 family protein n=1 Tax=Nakamurella panacisegetis TaxID=1090615 RepID=UPI0012FD971E|nr:glycosyltransferase 87 family protein [Nakamurella panacisegetis]
MDILRSTRSLPTWAAVDVRELPRRTRTIVIGVAVLGLLAAFAISFEIYRRFGAPRNELDLRIYYNAMASWHGGNDLYSYAYPDKVNGLLGFTYPPFAALIMSPLPMLSIRWIIAIAGLGIVATTVVLVMLSLRERMYLRRPQFLLATGLATAAAFCLQPVSQTLAYGQVNTALAVLVMVDVFVLGRRGSRFAGVGIGLAMAIKLTPAIFLVYLVIGRRWRMLRVAVATAAAATLAAALVVPADSWQYFTSLLWDAGRVGVVDNTANQSLNGTLARITGSLAPDKVVWAVGVLIVLAVGSVRIHRAVGAGDTLLAVTVTGLMGVLISPVSWIHHAVWIVPAVVVAVAQLVRTVPRHRFRPAAGNTRLDPADRTAMRRWIAGAGLLATGLFVFIVNTRNLFGLPDVHYAGRSIGAALAGSIQTIWMLAALVLLPIRTDMSSERPRPLAGSR